MNILDENLTHSWRINVDNSEHAFNVAKLVIPRETVNMVAKRQAAATVSYTHLDVYKRQTCLSILPIFSVACDSRFSKFFPLLGELVQLGCC